MQEILTGRASRPWVLDMLAGGDAIPFEALPFGCEAYALDLNPVAYIIELCTLVYPQREKSKYRLRDFGERGKDEKLGMPDSPGGTPVPLVPLIDVLHRTLWLMENRPGELPGFLKQAQPNREQMRLVAQALAGPALKGGDLPNVSPTGELAALTKLLANWKSVVEDAMISGQEVEDRRTGQQRIAFEGRNRRG